MPGDPAASPGAVNAKIAATKTKRRRNEFKDRGLYPPRAVPAEGSRAPVKNTQTISIDELNFGSFSILPLT
jgi:hypothetical protein